MTFGRTHINATLQLSLTEHSSPLRDIVTLISFGVP